MIKRWMSYDEFVAYLKDTYIQIGRETDQVLSIAGISGQLAQFDHKGLIFLMVMKLKKLRITTIEVLQSNRLDDRDEFEPQVELRIESYAVRKFDNEWKFSIDASELDAIRFSKN